MNKITLFSFKNNLHVKEHNLYNLHLFVTQSSFNLYLFVFLSNPVLTYNLYNVHAFVKISQMLSIYQPLSIYKITMQSYQLTYR